MLTTLETVLLILVLLTIPGVLVATGRHPLGARRDAAWRRRREADRRARRFGLARDVRVGGDGAREGN